MPHLTLEYTGNLEQEIDAFSRLFLGLHRILADVGTIGIKNCKSRAVRLDDYLIGEGTADGAFVHLGIRILEGCSIEVKGEIGRQCLCLLGEYFSASLARSELQITVEIIDMQRQHYFKLSG